MTVNYGRMRTFITVRQKDSEVIDTHTTDDFKDVAVIRGRVMPNAGKKFFEAAAVGAERFVTVIVRHKPWITESCELEFDGVKYRIISVVDIENRHMYMEIKVEAIVNG